MLQYFLFPKKKRIDFRSNSVLKNKVILITGATFGIGERTVYQLAQNNVTLILVARTVEKLEFLKNDLEKKGAKVFIFPTNLYDLNETENLIKQIRSLNLEIDLIISNAGKSICRSLENSFDRFHDFTRTMNINYLSSVRLFLEFYPDLLKRNGQIINVSALNVLLVPTPKWSAYQASKSAMDQWIRCNLPELEANKIAITQIYFPLVRTRMIAPNKNYAKTPAMDVEQAANVICNAIMKRNRIWKPWWSIFAELGSFVFNNLWIRFHIYQFKKEHND